MVHGMALLNAFDTHNASSVAQGHDTSIDAVNLNDYALLNDRNLGAWLDDRTQSLRHLYDSNWTDVVEKLTWSVHENIERRTDTALDSLVKERMAQKEVLLVSTMILQSQYN